MEGGIYGMSEKIEDATKFKTVGTAKKFIANCMTKEMKNFHWDLEQIDEEPLTESSEQPIMENNFLTKVRKLNDELQLTGYEISFKKVLKDYLNEIIKIVSSKERIIENLSFLDRTLTDVYHYIEMNPNMSAENCQHIVKLQNSILIKRRNCKNRLATISSLERIDLNQLEKTIQMFERMDNPKYTVKYKNLSK